MRKRFNTNKRFSSPHCAAIWMILKRTGYCCSPCQKYWKGKRMKVSLTGFFHLPLPSVPEILRCVECTGHKELSLEPHTVALRALREQFWGDTAGKRGDECGTDPSTATHRPYVHRESSKSAGPWTWSINHRSAVTEKRVWRRGENLFASWDQNKMFLIYLFTCWQDSAWVH